MAKTIHTTRQADKYHSEFATILRESVAKSGQSAAAIARAAGLPVGSFNNWCRGCYHPNREYLDKIGALEAALNLAPGTLLNLPSIAALSGRTHRRIEAESVGSSPYKLWLKTEREFFAARKNGRFLHRESWLAPLEQVWDEALQPSIAPALLALAVEGLHYRLDKRTVRQKSYHLGCYWAFLLDELGFKKEELSFALLASAELVDKFVEFEREHSNGKIYNSRIDRFLSEIVLPTLSEDTGVVWRRPELGTHPFFRGQFSSGQNARDKWSLHCTETAARLVVKVEQIEFARRNSPLRLSHDPEEGLRPLLLSKPGQALLSFEAALIRAANEEINRCARAAAVRDLAALLLAMYYGLSSAALASLVLGRHITLDGPGRLRLTRGELGFCGNDRARLGLDMPLLQSADTGGPDILAIITRLVDEFRPPSREPAPLFVSVTEGTKRSPHQALSPNYFGKRFALLSKKYLGDRCPGGFSFEGIHRLQLASLEQAGLHEIAQTWRSPFAPPVLPEADPRSLRDRQAYLVGELSSHMCPSPIN